MEGYVPSKRQAAGHDGCMISLENGCLFVKITSQKEIEFYAETQAKSNSTTDVQEGTQLVDWMPVYVGTLTQGDMRGKDKDETIEIEDTEYRMERDSLQDQKQKSDDKVNFGKPYIVLQNMYYGYTLPSILDIKLGSLLTDSSATPEKRERLQKISETTTSGSLNFRICGMNVYNGSLDNKPDEIYDGMSDHISSVCDESKHYYLEYNKMFGRSLTSDNIAEGLLSYFAYISSNRAVLEKLLLRFLTRLQLLYNCVLEEEVRIISGSLLFIYEGDLGVWDKVIEEDSKYEAADPLFGSECFENDDDEESDDSSNPDILADVEKEFNKESSTSLKRKAPLSSLSLIDLAHAKYVPGEGYDENIIIGIENLILIFEKLLHDVKEEI
ncbi:uncharacterized protein PRCAT00005457001 [Priceomyces carsonii]|uniref:uncharacterized protein n=1 Tax=Priceomyces carsonii TaxID=28549 RepID=UPI002EDB1CE3|nr:unnamed protein product [Priceomyces carsonii]